MGWWAVPDNDKLVLGDTVLDLTRHFLRNFAEEYEGEWGRKPSIDELSYVLNLAFKVNVDNEIVSDFDDQEVKQVILKTAKRPKRRKSKPGDIFAFELEKGRYGFGRVIAKLSMGSAVEIFDYFAAQPVFDYSKLGKWLIKPITIDSYSLLDTQSEGDWRIIDNTPDFILGKEFEKVKFVYGSTPGSLMTVDIFGNHEPISALEATQYSPFEANGDHDVKGLIKSKLS